MLYLAGQLRAEDRALRHVARSRVNAALDSLATHLDGLTEVLISRLTPQQAAHWQPEQLLAALLEQPRVAQLRLTLERYCADFPALREEAERTRERLYRRAYRRLRAACEPFHYQRRFRYTRGLRSH
jgi:hypothetical protein